ncbi:MAG: aspartate/glutamate racemase family protein [Chromatiales bacterium]|nr:aspartate/glutamate racemase family protein [Chromatiales bacterium]
MTRAYGGKAVYGASMGMLLLETRFPRIPGDGGNAATWPFPVLWRVVSGATPDRVVRDRGGGVEDFVAAGRELVALGADGITTNCGFLVLHQERLARECGVPVAASSLLQVPWVERLLPPGRRVGVVTVEAASLTPKHLECAGARPDTPVEGTEDGAELTRVLLGDELELDVDRAREDVLAAARRLVERNRDVGAIVLECTNMPPYAADVSRATGLPVHDFHSFVCWFQAGLRPRTF